MLRRAVGDTIASSGISAPARPVSRYGSLAIRVTPQTKIKITCTLRSGNNMRLLTALVLAAPLLLAQPPLKVGVTQRAFVPARPYVWRGAKTHALPTTIWYPAHAASV